MNQIYVALSKNSWKWAHKPVAELCEILKNEDFPTPRGMMNLTHYLHIGHGSTEENGTKVRLGTIYVAEIYSEEGLGSEIESRKSVTGWRNQDQLGSVVRSYVDAFDLPLFFLADPVSHEVILPYLNMLHTYNLLMSHCCNVSIGHNTK